MEACGRTVKAAVCFERQQGIQEDRMNRSIRYLRRPCYLTEMLLALNLALYSVHSLSL